VGLLGLHRVRHGKSRGSEGGQELRFEMVETSPTARGKTMAQPGQLQGGKSLDLHGRYLSHGSRRRPLRRTVARRATATLALRRVLLRASANDRPIDAQPGFDVFLAQILEELLQVANDPAFETFDEFTPLSVMRTRTWRRSFGWLNRSISPASTRRSTKPVVAGVVWRMSSAS